MALFERQDPDDCITSSAVQLCKHTKSVYTVDSQNVEAVNNSCGDCLKEPNFGICTYYSYSKQTKDFESSVYDENYVLLETIDYPFEERDPEEVVMHDIIYKLSVLGRCNGIYYSYEENRAEIPLNQLTEWDSDGQFISESELRYCHLSS